MSDLLNSASLVMIPSGYKEDVVYSQIPTDGSGDLSFTRASNGTRVNSAGLVEVCPWNLLQYSEQIDNGVWTKFSPTSVTADTTTAPNGTATADTISTSATAVIRQSVTLNANETYTYSIYVKKISYDFFGFQSLISGTGVKSVFDLSNGTVTSQGSGHTASIESVGNGWYRCIITFNVGSSASNIFDLAADGTSSTLRTFYAWGAQLNIGSTAKPYFPTTDRLNVPRLTYQNGGGGCPSLLLEKQSTNAFSYSEQFDNAYWAKARTTITANSIISPDGTQNADVIYPNTDPNTSHEIFNNITTSAINGWSGYFKMQGHRWIGLFGSGDPVIFYDLQNGVIGNVGAGLSGSITNMGNGWYRCTYIKTSGLNSVWGFGFADSNGNMGISGTPNTSLGVGIWGFQAENSSYPTSYIPTTSSSATRVADACFKTGISSLLNATQGTIFLDFERLGPSGADPENYVFIGDGSLNNFVNLVYYPTSQRYTAQVRAGGITSGSVQALSDYTGRVKIALAYAANDLVMYINGTQQGTDSSVTVSSSPFDTLGVGGYYDTAYGDTGRCKINQFVISKTRLTNAELASLTTI